MRAWVSKISFGWQILKACTLNSVRMEFAYFANNWGAVLSTVVYTAAAILGTKIIFSNIKLLAGYTYSEMLFMLLISQLAFYIHYTLADSLDQLIIDVNSGNFDFLLTRPVPTFYFNLIRTVPIVSAVRDCVPPLILICYFIPWADIHLSPLAFIAGLIIFICGSLCWYLISFALVLPSFWFGQAREIYRLDYRFSDSHDTPFEGYPGILRALLSTIIPVLIVGPLSASVLLGKQPAVLSVGLTILVTISFSILIRFAWNKSLRNYSSASS